MARAYNVKPCTICGRLVSQNGLATSSHAKSHVRLGEMEMSRGGRFTATEQGLAKAKETNADLKKLKAASLEAARAYNAVPEGSFAWSAAYDAVVEADSAYINYGRK